MTNTQFSVSKHDKTPLKSMISSIEIPFEGSNDASGDKEFV